MLSNEVRLNFYQWVIRRPTVYLECSDHILVHIIILSEPHRYVNGEHYSKTLEAWLKKHDGNWKRIMPLFEQTYGSRSEAVVWFNRWRIFYIACSELFRYGGGDEWGVGHYLFQKKP